MYPDKWKDYELLDSGDGMKLERWGTYTISRPDPHIIWNKSWPESKWQQADASFVKGGEEGEWKFNHQPPMPWEVTYGQIRFALRPTDFKHVGVFPEQAVNWDWLTNKLENQNPNIKLLNLFAYTGGTTMAMALTGANVTHVDSSRPAMMWASENAKLSRIPKENIRWIQEDAVKFVQREIKRGAKYDGIVMDPPKFGRGTGGEVWKLEEDLGELVWACKKILSDNPLFVLVNAYTADMSHLAIKHLLSDAMKAEVESGELGVRESASGKILPAGVFARWSK